MFAKSKMHLQSGLGLGTGRIMNTLCLETCGVPINLFLIPEYEDTGRWKFPTNTTVISEYIFRKVVQRSSTFRRLD